MRILLLGATSEVASSLAQLWAQRGDQLVLVGRNAEGLARLEKQLGPAVQGTAVFDLVTERAPDQLKALLESEPAFDLAFLAHGDLGDQNLAQSSAPEARRILEVNLNSLVALLVPLSEKFESQGYGQVGVISSVAGERGRPRNYTYGAAKAGLTVYLQGLRSRLWGRVAVTTIKLGPVHTRMTTHHQKNALFLSRERAARLILKALDRRAAEVFVPGLFYWILLFARIIPEWMFQRLSFLSDPPAPSRPPSP